MVPETLKVKALTFQTLGEPLHIGGIVGMSVCSWKPIVMTAGKHLAFNIYSSVLSMHKKYAAILKFNFNLINKTLIARSCHHGIDQYIFST